MNRLLRLILVIALLITCYGCFIPGRGWDGDHDRGDHGDRDRGGHGDRDGGRHNEQERH